MWWLVANRRGAARPSRAGAAGPRGRDRELGSERRRRAGWGRPIALAALAVGSFLLAHGLTRLRAGDRTGPPPPGMRWIPPGEFAMGSGPDVGRPEETPAHRVRLDGFWIDEREVTNAQFARFAAATGHVTTAERVPDVDAIMAQVPPGTPPPPPGLLVPGSLVFRPTAGPVPRDDPARWWHWTPGASWRHPEGPGSDLIGRAEHPVVHVSWDDAMAYAHWAGRRLPTEAEWECAARGGQDGQPYTWGDAAAGDGGHWRANIWQGNFPARDDAADGFAGTAPVGSFPPNGYGLHDMAGNVWEWCADRYDRDLYRWRAGGPTVANPAGPAAPDDPARAAGSRRAQRGGSFLCNDAYCARYRPAARQGGSPDTGMSHVGFRCALSPAPSLRGEDR